MKILTAAVAALAVLVAPGLACAQPHSARIVVPGGTAIPVHVIGEVSSSSAKPADTFHFAAAQNVVIDGMLVIRSGALGSGTIADVVHAGGGGHSGSVTLTFGWIYAVDGGKIRLAPAAEKQSEQDRKGAASTATIIGVATLGWVGLFGHNLAHGKEVTIDDAKMIDAFVADSVHVESHEPAAAADHFDR